MNVNQMRRNSYRLEGYDYSQEGCYFVTICAQGRQCLFGEIIDDGMVLNDAGKMAARWWNETKNKFPHVELDEYVVMPNHFHGIVVIVGADLRVRPEARDRKPDGCQHAEQQRKDNNLQGGHAGPPLQEIIQWFKTMSTNEYIKEVKSGRLPPFEKHIWQRSFYDHVIRDDEDMNRVREYIQNNPLKWSLDEYNPLNQTQL